MRLKSVIAGRRAASRRASEEAVRENTQAMRDLLGAVEAQQEFAQAACQVTSADALRVMTDCIGAQLGRRDDPGGAGSLARL